MDTNELIERLSSDTGRISPAAGANRLAIGFVAGGAFAMGLLTLAIGQPFGAVADTGIATFGVKLGFTLATLLIAAILLLRAARPGSAPRRSAAWLAVPGVVVALLALMAFASAPAELRPRLIFGQTWQSCLTMVFLLSLPVYAGLCWALRKLAPTDLNRAGTLAGLAAGSMSAFIYALHCPEVSPAFLVLWYGLAILLAGLLGRLTGPRIMRW